MRKILILASFVYSSLSSAQTTRVYSKHVQVSEKLQLKTRNITDFSINLFSADSNSDTKIPTAKAVADFVRARGGGGGGGAVSSVFGRIGPVVADGNDYSAFYSPISHTHPLSALTQSGAANGQVPVWNTLLGWVPGTVSGGSAPADSVFGNAYDMVGSIVNDVFTGTSLSGQWTDVTPTSTVTVNNKITFAGGAGDFSNYIQFSKFAPYSLLSDTVFVTPKVLSATSGIGIGYQGQNQFSAVNYHLYVKLDLSNAVTAGELSLWYNTTTKFASAPKKVKFSIDDQLMIVVNKRHNNYVFEVYNLTVGSRVSYEYTFLSQNFGSAIVPPANKTRIFHFGGTMDVTNFKKFSYERKNGGVIFVGNSIATMYSGTSGYSKFANRIFNGDFTRFAMTSGAGETALDGLNKLEEVYDNNYQYAIIEYGVNDANQGVSPAVYQANMDSIRARFERRGTIVIFINNFPQNAVDVTNWNTSLNNLKVAYGNKVVDVYSVLKNTGNTQAQSQYTNDGIHPNDSGMYIFEREIVNSAPEITSVSLYDSVATAYVHAPAVDRNKIAAFLGTDIKGRAVRVFNNFVTKDEAVPMINNNAVANGLVIGPQSTLQRGLMTIDIGGNQSLYAYNSSNRLIFKMFNTTSFPFNGSGVEWHVAGFDVKNTLGSIMGGITTDGTSTGVYTAGGFYWGTPSTSVRRLMSDGNGISLTLPSNAGDFKVFNNNGTLQLFATYFEGAWVLPQPGYQVSGATGRMNYFNGLRLYESGIWKKAWLNDPGKGHVPDAWTTAGRPASPVNGQFGYNTTTNNIEYYSQFLAAWVAVTGGVADGNKVDITVAGNNWTVNPGAITKTKIENVTPGYVLGRSSTTSGAPQEVKTYIVLAEGSTSAAATLDIDLTNWYNDYDVIVIELFEVVPVSDGAVARIRVSDDGVSYASGANNYKYAFKYSTSIAGSGLTGASETYIPASGTASGVDNAASASYAATLTIRAPGNISYKPKIKISASFFNNSGDLFDFDGSGSRENAQACRGVQFSFAPGNIATAKYKILGLKSNL